MAPPCGQHPDRASATGGKVADRASVLSRSIHRIRLQVGVFRVDLGVSVLTMATPGVKQPSDELLPLEMREPPEDLAALDELLSDPRLLAPMADCWQAMARERGRPSIAIETYARSMVIKQRSG
jgi:hypothetical protein